MEPRIFPTDLGSDDFKRGKKFYGFIKLGHCWLLCRIVTKKHKTPLEALKNYFGPKFSIDCLVRVLVSMEKDLSDIVEDEGSSFEIIKDLCFRALKQLENPTITKERAKTISGRIIFLFNSTDGQKICEIKKFLADVADQARQKVLSKWKEEKRERHRIRQRKLA